MPPAPVTSPVRPLSSASGTTRWNVSRPTSRTPSSALSSRRSEEPLPELTPAAFRARLATGGPGSVCLLLGDDAAEKRALIEATVATIDEGIRLFNVDRFQGDETTIPEVLDAAQTLPMMAARRVIVVLHAEHVLQPKRESQAATEGLSALEAYLEEPAPHATVLLEVADLDERRRVFRRISEAADVVRCGDLADATDAGDWIVRRLKEMGREAEPAAVRLLAAVVGSDASALRGALDRLSLYAADAPRITVEDVRTVVGASVAGPDDDWAVARAIEQRDTRRALREVGLALEAGAVPYMVLGQLAWVARSRLGPTRTGPAIDAVFRTDRALKQSGGDPRVLLERLVAELCGGRGRAPAGGGGPRGRR
ncbi:MAG: DNA polymerase III subunit delta [Acidobacteria bacterium]|nr:DNA polymerase III subunit delta [Acidobacteriota bacterium]MYJ02825.1 DNA polymerase III subunit delta [Acidobacteriota bacterium]